MREFTDIQRQLGLKEFLESPMGTLYFVPSNVQCPELIVRRFDGEAPPALVQPYAEIVRAAQQWIERHPELAPLVRVEQPAEVGADFIARKHHVYYVRTASYADRDEPLEPPEELEEMRAKFRAAIGRSKNPRDVIIECVLARSLLLPTGKTYPGESEDEPGLTQFIVVDLKLTREDLEEWAALSSAATSRFGN